MSAQELLFEQIELYLNKQMNPTEEADFEARMASDGFLKASVELHRDLAKAITNKEEIELEAKLRHIGNEYFAKKTLRRIPLWQNRSWLVAASISLLAIVGAWLYLSGPSHPQHQELYASHYEPYSIPDGFQGLRDDSGISADPLAQAVGLYEKKAYEPALQSFRQLPDSSLNTPLVQICMGICYLQTGEVSQAQKHFEQLLQKEDHFFKSPAQWYLALSHLKEGNKTEVKQILEPMSNDAGKYGKLARNLLDKM